MKIALPIALLALTALVPSGAAAQLAPNSDAPVDIASDQFELTNSTCATIWTGSAEALQGTTRLRGDVLKTFQKVKTPGATGSDAKCGELERLEAQGSVYYVTPQQRARGDNAVYVASTETITMTGNVVVVQGQNVMKGERFVINTRTGQASAQGTGKGRNSQGRVRAVFYPDQPAPQPR